MLEAIDACQKIAGRELDWSYTEDNRIGDHIWWIGDLAAFKADHPDWDLRYDVDAILRDIYEANVEKWQAERETV
jgi:CDP-paratose 2-epimerase